MESSLTATVHGRVREVLVSANAQVPAGKPLLQVDPLDDAPSAGGGGRARCPSSPPSSTPAALERLGWAVLGYDVTADEVARALATVPEQGDPDAERRLLELYADVRTLDRPHADGLDQELGSPQEHLHAFLRSLDAEAEGLPERFVAHLGRALSHYGVESLERTAALEHAGYRLFLARQRARTAREGVRGLLAARLERGEPLDDAYRAVLDRLEAALAPREPALAELAREVRWRCCDEPALAAAREATYTEMAGHLTALGETTTAPSASRASPRWSTARSRWPRCSSRLPGDAGALVEAMTRRYYRIRPLEGTREQLLDGVPFVLSTYEREDRRHHVAATLGRARRAAGGDARARRARPHAPRRASRCWPTSTRCAPSPRTSTACWPGPSCRTASRASCSCGRPRPRTARSTCAPTHATTTAGSARIPTVRGMHPMMAERLDVWRLREFDLERLPSAQDVYLFRAVAHDEPARRAAGRARGGARPHAGPRRVRPHHRAARARADGPRVVRGDAQPSRRAGRRASACTGTGCCSTPGRRWTSTRPRRARSSAASRARAPGSGSRWSSSARGCARTASSATARCASSAPRAAASPSSSATRRTQPLQPLDEGAQRIITARRRGSLHPAEIVKVLAPQPAQPGSAIPAGEFVEHDLDARRPARPGRPPAGDQPRQHRGRARPQPHRAPPRGHAARGRCSATRRARSARSPSRSASA